MPSIQGVMGTVQEMMTNPRQLTLEESQALASFFTEGLGVLLAKQLDMLEFTTFERDVDETDYAQTLINKGYIKGIRDVRSFFQHCYEVVVEARKKQEREERDGRNR